MVQYKDIKSNITFNSVNVSVSELGKGLSRKGTAGATAEDLSDIAADNGGILPSIVNAVEIDWNGAQVAGKTLNTTGEVLSSYKVAI